MNQDSNSNIESKINEDISPTKKLKGLHLKIVLIIAVIWSFFQLWYASPFPFILKQHGAQNPSLCLDGSKYAG